MIIAYNSEMTVNLPKCLVLMAFDRHGFNPKLLPAATYAEIKARLDRMGFDLDNLPAIDFDSVRINLSGDYVETVEFYLRNKKNISLGGAAAWGFYLEIKSLIDDKESGRN